MSINRYAWAAALLVGPAAVAAIWVGGCGKTAPPLPGAAHPRLVTFSPALTQMAFDMGLGAHVVGVTGQCTVPSGFHPAVVGDAFQVVAEPILAAQPDAVLIQMDAKRFEPFCRVAPRVKVVAFTIETLDDIAAAIGKIGEVAGRPDLADAALAKWKKELQEAEDLAAGKARPRVFFVMGYRRPATGGANSFVSQMIARAGGQDAAGTFGRWSAVGAEDVAGAKPDVLVCLMDSDAGKPDDARTYWQGVFRAAGRPAVRVVILTDPGWTVPGLRTAGYVRQLAGILHGEGPR